MKEKIEIVPKCEIEKRLEAEGSIRIGNEYQVTQIPNKQNDYDESIQGKCLWDPLTVKDDEIGLEKYLSKSKDLNWPEYPALTLLSALRYDFDAASEYLDSLEYVAPADRWTEEEKRLFLSSFSLYGKNFEKIHVWLKNKTMKELIEFYYFLKSKKQIISPGFQQEKTFAANTDSKLKRCADKVNQYENIYDIGELQKDIEKSCDHVTPDNAAELKIEKLESQIVSIHMDIQTKKEQYNNLRNQNDQAMAPLRQKCTAGQNSKQIFRWEDQEIYYFSMALKEFGKDYEYISKIIETKQPSRLEKFYNENCEKFLLNAAYQEYLDAQKDDDVEEIPTESTDSVAPSQQPAMDEDPVVEDLPCEIEMIDD